MFHVSVCCFMFHHIFKGFYHSEEGTDADPEEEQHKVFVVEFCGEGKRRKEIRERVGVGGWGEGGKGQGNRVCAARGTGRRVKGKKES